MHNVDYDVIEEAVLKALESEREEYSYTINEDCYIKFIDGKGFYETGVRLYFTKDGKTETQDYKFSYFIDCLADAFLYGSDIIHNICVEIQEHIRELYGEKRHTVPYL